MNRRTFITTAGAIALAGCTSDDGEEADPFEESRIFAGIEEIGCSAFDDGCAVYIAVSEEAVENELFDEIAYRRDGVELGRKERTNALSYRFEERHRYQDAYTFIAYKDGEEVDRIEVVTEG